MRGTKRAAISDSTPIFNSNDSFMQSKRLVMGSSFDAHKAEPSIPLDLKRAESSKQHVRALNTQFASWVQAQLQNHPDELWEDGVQDYLNHAKSIMKFRWESNSSGNHNVVCQGIENLKSQTSSTALTSEKFSDVVIWLKANAAKGESSGEHRSNDAQTKPTSEIDKSSHKLFLDKPGFPAFHASTTANSGSSSSPGGVFSNNASYKFGATTASSGSPWNPGSIFNNNAPSMFGGNQVSVPGNANAVPSSHVASNEGDGEDDVEQPSSPSVKKSQEEGIVVVHEVKCKLYVKSSDPQDKDAWKDKGMGQLSIKCKEGISKGTKESKPTIVVRNDVGKVLLNALLYLGIKTNVQKNSVVAIFHTSADDDNNNAVVARTFLMRTKTEDDRDKLVAAIQEYAPAD